MLVHRPAHRRLPRLSWGSATIGVVVLLCALSLLSGGARPTPALGEAPARLDRVAVSEPAPIDWTEYSGSYARTFSQWGGTGMAVTDPGER